jgi:hypothetical protein
MFSFGIGMILSSAPALAGVLHALATNLTKDFHARLMDNPLDAPRTWFERRHMTKSCSDCSMIAEMVVTRL